MIVVFGTICLDRIRRVPHLPEPGACVETDEEVVSLGGEAANTAACLMRLGARVRLFGNPTGEDEDGSLLRDALLRAGLPTPGTAGGYETPVCDIMVAPDGERAMVGHGFSTIEGSHVRLPELDGGDWFTADPNLQASARRAAASAQERGLRTYLMDFIRDEDRALLDGCDVWQSSTDWAGKRGDWELNLDLCRAHARRHDCLTILTDGPAGLVVCEPGTEPRRLPAFRCEQVVDTTGAGDAFRGGMLFGLDRGLPLSDSLRLAACVGCLSCRKMGAVSALPTLQEALEFIAAHPEVAAAYV
ncbi:MAG: carbohydrate kinase family protein [Armatimonadetes bacterium]|nr:carbohydrate kinase family protein [Armatimonadota bacterium]